MLTDEKIRPASNEADRGIGTNHRPVYSARDLGVWYVMGVQHERERAAGAWYEADTSWTRSGKQVAQSRYDEMMALFEECAHRFHEQQLGRPYIPFLGRGA